MNQISFTGNGLNIMIAADYNLHHEWMAFSSWHSTHKVLPDADVCVVIPKITKSHFYRWTIRAGVKQCRIPNFNDCCPAADKLLVACAVLVTNPHQPFLLIDAGVVAAREIDHKLTSRFGISADKAVWFINGVTKEELVASANNFFKLYETNKESSVIESLKIIKGYEDIDGLCCDCKTNSTTSFISLNDYCGNYNKKTWLEKAKSSPFAHVRNFKSINTSINEQVILKSWEQMQQTYLMMC